MDAACEVSSIRSRLILRPQKVVFGALEYCLTQTAPTRADQAILSVRSWEVGAAEGTRTPDPIITNDVLYQLSYCGFRRGS